MDVTCLHLLFHVVLKVQFVGFGGIWQGGWPPCRESRWLVCPSCTTVTAWGTTWRPLRKRTCSLCSYTRLILKYKNTVLSFRWFYTNKNNECYIPLLPLIPTHWIFHHVWYQNIKPLSRWQLDSNALDRLSHIRNGSVSHPNSPCQFRTDLLNECITNNVLTLITDFTLAQMTC